MSITLKPHQREGLQFIREKNGCAGVFMRPGTGKTIVAIRYARQFRLNLILCRRDDMLTWTEALKDEGYDPFFCIHELWPTNIDAIRSMIGLEGDYSRWVICTYDTAKNEEIAKFLRSVAWDCCIADESWMIAHIQAERTKSVIKSTKHIPHKLALNGTAIGNDVVDLFSQCLFIDGGKTFGTSEWHFRNEYYLRDGVRWFQRRDAKPRLIEKLKTMSFYVHEDDVLKLPPVSRLMKAAPMSKEQKVLYEQVLKDWCLELAFGQIEIDHIVAQLTKLRQIANGYASIEDQVQTMPCPKLDLLMEMLDTGGELQRKEKVVIWTPFTKVIDRICEMSKWKAVPFYGSNKRLKDAARQSFAKDPRVRLFVGQADSGVGMNELIVADTAIYCGHSTRTRSKTQSDARIRRTGSEIHKRITYYDLITEGTVELKGLRDLNRGIDLASSIMEALKKGNPLRSSLSLR